MTESPKVEGLKVESRTSGIFDSAAALLELQQARKRAMDAVGKLVAATIDERQCRLNVGDYSVLRLTNAEGTRWNVTGPEGTPLDAHDDVAPAVAYAVSAALTDLVYDAVCETYPQAANRS